MSPKLMHSREVSSSRESWIDDIADIEAEPEKPDHIPDAGKMVGPEHKPAFYGFMNEEQCCVDLCFTPWAPGGPNNELPTAYYTAPPQPTHIVVEKP